MPAKDLYHDVFVRALQKDGWTITHEPLTVKVGETDLFIDLGAERFIVAEKANERVAIEVKSFIRLSAIQDLKEAVGQFVLYNIALQQSPENADRTLFLAIRNQTYETLFSEDLGRILLSSHSLRLVVFDPATEVIVRWIQ